MFIFTSYSIDNYYYNIVILIVHRVTRCACWTTSFTYWTTLSWRTSRVSRHWKRTLPARCSRPRLTVWSRKSYFPSSRSCMAWKKDVRCRRKRSTPLAKTLAVAGALWTTGGGSRQRKYNYKQYLLHKICTICSSYEIIFMTNRKNYT